MDNDASRTNTVADGELIFLVKEAPEGGFTARALGESIFTEADDLATLRENVRDAVHCHFEEGFGPRIVRLHFVQEEIGPGPRPLPFSREARSGRRGWGMRASTP